MPRHILVMFVLLSVVASAAPPETTPPTLAKEEFLKRLTNGAFTQPDGSYTITAKAVKDGELQQLEIVFQTAAKEKATLKAPIATVRFDDKKKEMCITFAKGTIETPTLTGELIDQEYRFALPRAKK